MTLKRVHLIHWDEGEAAGRAVRLRRAGYAVSHRMPRGMEFVQALRGAGLAKGLVDYKVCAVDETWSWLLVTRRKS